MTDLSSPETAQRVLLRRLLGERRIEVARRGTGYLYPATYRLASRAES